MQTKKRILTNEDKEGLRLQVILKAEEAGIPCSDEDLPRLMKLAERKGAPFVPWEFEIIQGRARARRKNARTGRPKTIYTKTLFCRGCGRRRVKSFFMWDGHKYVCKDCLEEKKLSSTKFRDTSRSTSDKEE